MGKEEQKRVLIVDDDASHRLMLRETLLEDGYDTLEAASGEEALELVSKHPCDLVLLDLKMPGMGGIQTLKHLKIANPPLPVLIMTAYATVNTAVQALKEGAFDYLIKPLDIHELKEVIETGMAPPTPPDHSPQLPPELSDLEIVAESSIMQDLLGDIARVAPTDATVLLEGESGSGKEVLAEAIYHLSPRSSGVLLHLNCAAIPENLVESELFGHRKGAFTGADSDKDGKFVSAMGGTLFLDEVGELPLAAQAKLLRVLQDGKITPVGGTRERKTDVRIVAATNRDLELEVKEGRFREDLYYRLSVFPIKVPPLRERKIDIPSLADLFIKRFIERHRKNLQGLTPRAMSILVSYDWPGNVRELMNALERGVILSRGSHLSEEDLPPSITGTKDDGAHPTDTMRSGISLKEMEKMLIQKTLSENKGNRTHAARTLGITRKTLLSKIKEYGIEG
jgi:two-component system response regulator HydG